MMGAGLCTSGASARGAPSGRAGCVAGDMIEANLCYYAPGAVNA